MSSSLDDTTITGSHDARRASREVVPALTILAHPDPRRIGEQALMADLRFGSEVRLSRTTPAFGHPGRPADRPLEDRSVSRSAIVLGPAGDGGIQVDPSAVSRPPTRDGQIEAGPFLLTRAELDVGDVLEVSPRVAVLVHRVPPATPSPPPAYGMQGESAGIVALRAEIARVGPQPVPVLVRGETGVGKELAARALHQASGRAGRFVSVNIAAIPPTTAASALFGHTRGAFTGAAAAAAGYFEAADGGTLFLDEVGATPPGIQAALLRALESGEIQPVGATGVRQVDVRVISATDEDLEREVDAGRFRLPLLQRLRGYELAVPPLRERRDDIARLLIHFLRDALADLGASERLEPVDGEPWLSAPLVARLVRWHWPGNIRELRHVARRVAIASSHLRAATLDAATESSLRGGPDGDAAEAEASPSNALRRVEDFDEDEVTSAMARAGYRPGRAAELLGVSRTTLYALIERFDGLRKAGDLTIAEIQSALAAEGGDVAAAARRLRVSGRGLKLRIRALGMEVAP